MIPNVDRWLTQEPDFDEGFEPDEVENDEPIGAIADALRGDMARDALGSVLVKGND